MVWAFFGAVAVGLIAVFAALVTGRLRYDPMSPPVHTAPDPDVGDISMVHDAPSSQRVVDQVAAVRFDTALRGYRMDQVDQVLLTLTERLMVVEEELALLRGAGEAPSGPGAGATPSSLGADATLSGPGAGATPSRPHDAGPLGS